MKKIFYTAAVLSAIVALGTTPATALTYAHADSTCANAYASGTNIAISLELSYSDGSDTLYESQATGALGAALEKDPNRNLQSSTADAWADGECRAHDFWKCW